MQKKHRFPLYREPYRSKKRTVFRLFTKSANRTEPKIINFSIFTIKKTVNGPYFGTVPKVLKNGHEVK